MLQFGGICSSNKLETTKHRRGWLGTNKEREHSSPLFGLPAESPGLAASIESPVRARGRAAAGFGRPVAGFGAFGLTA